MPHALTTINFTRNVKGEKDEIEISKLNIHSEILENFSVAAMLLDNVKKNIVKVI